MNFFEHQDQARRRTKVLVAYYALAVILIILAIYGAALLIITTASSKDPLPGYEPGTIWLPEVFISVAIFTTVVILSGTAYKVLSLRGGGSQVARMLGGREVTGSPQNPAEQRFVNVVEEMAIASGIPVPAMFILDHEPGINAFAAGFSTRDAVVAVTRGTLEQLDRDQLQGVIGHEFSHILNGDMRLNLKLMGVLHGILLISLIGYWAIRMAPRSRGRKEKGGIAAVMFISGLALYLIGWIGVFFGNLIKSAVSRQREFLADASAVQFTRNPAGLAGALAVIGGSHKTSLIQHPSSQEASHFFFANGVARGLNSLFATHPPLQERIQRINPSWTGKTASPTSSAPPLASAGKAVPSEAMLGFVGQPAAVHLQTAGTLISQIPAAINTSLHKTDTVESVAYGLLLAASDEGLRNQQLAQLRQRIPAPAMEALHDVVKQLLPLSRAQRVPILDLALPALRHLPAARYTTFRENILHIVSLDQSVDLYEFIIMRTLLRTLDRHFQISPPALKSASPLKGAALRPHVEVLMTALAWLGSGDRTLAARAFEAAMSRVYPGSQSVLAAEPPALDVLESTLDALENTSHKLRGDILAACGVCISADGILTHHEAELFRAVSSSLECPMPPLAMAVNAS